MFIQRIRTRFRKTGALKTISHLDLMRAFERALRRTGLPLRMTEGFNPHPRLSFPVALPVGIEGLDEVMEFELSEWVPPAEVERRLREQLPDELGVISAVPAPPGDTARAVEVVYRVTPYPEYQADARLAPEALAQVMAREEILVERHRKGKQKSVNIRPFILSLEREGPDMVIRLTAGPEGSAHPDEIFGALGFDMAGCRTGFTTVRTRVQLAR